MKIEGDRITFSTGAWRIANSGIVGLGPDLGVREGYDGEFDTELPGLTPAEWRELAEHMIAEWTRFRAKHGWA